MPTRSQPWPAEFTRSAGRDRDLALCRAQLSNGSRTFLAASLLLPGAVRDPACALYAFCREADDAVDTQGAPVEQAVLALHERLDRVYQGLPCTRAADRALARVVHQFAIPRALPAALLEGFEWDAAQRRYATLESLCDYAARVAGAVGAMMALLMGVRSAEGLARACDLGVAMQLSNIARDVGEDARMGRLYLPLQWLDEAGIDADAWLADPQFTPALASVTARLLQAADQLYARVDAGIALLPVACRPGINAARQLYAEIGHEVKRRGFNSVDGRAVVSPARKVRVLLGALLSPLLLTPTAWRQGRAEPALPSVQFLVDAGSATLLPDAAAAPGRIVWLIALFERLERRDLQAAGRH